MQRNEHLAMDMLEKYQDALKIQVEKNSGEIVKNYGDGSICLFPTANGAVACANELQLTIKNEVPLRIGLHLGDIIFKGDDVYGDALNIASRIESMGVSGNVLLSQSMHNKVKNQPGFSFQLLGKFAFKNVELPLEVYALTNDGIIVPKKNQLSGKFNQSRITIPNLLLWILPILVLSIIFFINYSDLREDEPVFDVAAYSNSIAVLPFKDLSETQDQKYLGYGLSTEIINLLSRVPQLKVIGRTSSFAFEGKDIDIRKIADSLDVNFVLEGTIRKNDKSLKIDIQLVDGTTGKSVYSENFTEDINNLFQTQERIAIRTCNKLKISIANNAMKSYKEPSIQAHLLYLQSDYLRTTSFHQELDKMEELLLRAYQLDSTYIPVLNGLSDVYLFKARYNKMDKDAAGVKMLQYIEEMGNLDSTSYYTLFSEAMYNLDFESNLEKVFTNLNKISLTSDMNILVMSGSGFYIGLNDIDRGIYMVEKALERDPLYPWNYLNLGYLYYMNKDFDYSMKMLFKYSEMADTRNYSDMYSLIKSLTGDIEEAFAYANEIKDEGIKMYSKMIAHYYNNDTDNFKAFMNNLKEKFPNLTIEIAEAHSLNGEVDLAFQLLEQAYKNQEFYALSGIKYNHFLENLHSDIRWKEFLIKVGFPELLKN